jgi:hypothetical protein
VTLDSLLFAFFERPAAMALQKNTRPYIYRQARRRNFPSGGKIVESIFVIALEGRSDGVVRDAYCVLGRGALIWLEWA